MGLFDVFKKKDCEICGKEVGMFGYKKLEDGEICKDCVKLLSPWFDDRRHSTVEQIKSQLEAREHNKLALETWQYSIAIGDYYTMYVKTKADVPITFVVSNTANFRENNADILPFLWVASCTPDIRESHTELKQTNEQGEKVSFNPPRYEYRYDFYIKLDIQGCSYIDDMRFRINSSTVELETVMPKATLFGTAQSFDPMLYPEYRKYKAMLDEICEIVSCGQRGVALGDRSAGDDSVEGLLAQIRNAPTKDAMSNAFFRLTMLTKEHPDKARIGEQMNQALREGQNRLGVAIDPMPQSQPAATWKCDACGSENTGKFCQGCGAAKPTPAPASASGWKCFCGTFNTGKFCAECGTEQYSAQDIVCSECSWTAEPGDVTIPVFCPNCGRRFDADDL